MRAVYTAVIGGYEELHEQPVAADSRVPFVCFTDDPGLHSATWDVRLVTPALALDPVRSSRALKLVGHDDLSAYDETLWVDARVVLRVDPDTILDGWLDGADVAIPRHSYRTDVVAEFDAVLQLGYDDSSRLYEQLTHYATLAPELLEAPVPWTGMLARRHGPAVARAMDEWLLHVLRYSRRDQLSAVHTLATTGVAWRPIPIDNHRSEVHVWQEPRGRSGRLPVLGVSDSLQPPIARLGELRNQLDHTRHLLAVEVAEREEQVRALEAELAAARPVREGSSDRPDADG